MNSIPTTQLFLLLFLALFTFNAPAEDNRNLFLDWLSKEDPAFSKNIIEQASARFREQNGPFKSRYSDFRKENYSEDFLELVDQTFLSKTGKNITDFSNLANVQMKEGLSSSVSRYSDATKTQFGGVYSQYLSTNLRLAQSGRPLNTSEANQAIWKANAEQVAANESMGGNAGPGAIAVNFLFDKRGRIVFVGNIQDASDGIKEQYGLKRLSNGTVRYAVDRKVWQLLIPDPISATTQDKLTRDLTQLNEAPPQISYSAFEVQCDLVLRKMLRR